MQAGKHVIFLGAGASKGSGYPLANELRLLISSRKNWENALLDYGKKHRIPDTPLNDLDSQLTAIGLSYWDKHTVALDLFRNGGFATIDEFCKLAGHRFRTQIDGLRCLVRAALGLFNPEETFEKSEYYGFVQALFEADLTSLRDDITVLTYNYDPYLGFLFYRALKHRWRIIREGGPLMSQQDIDDERNFNMLLNAVTSGFADPTSLRWLDQDKAKQSFCLLQLHGSIGSREDVVCGFDSLFSPTPLVRAQKLFAQSAGCIDQMLPPLLFPWEIMTDEGFVKKSSFPFQDGGGLYNLFRGVWERARREVQSAEKISFVGLSMHDFLLDGLRFLFKDKKKGDVEIVVANPDNISPGSSEIDTRWGHLPHAPAYAVNKILSEFSPALSQTGLIPAPGPNTDRVTLVRDFAEFVKTQLRPKGPNIAKV